MIDWLMKELEPSEGNTKTKLGILYEIGCTLERGMKKEGYVLLQYFMVILYLLY